MPNTRSRKLIVVLASGALTMFGASSAFAAGSPLATPADHGGDHGGGGGGGGGGEDPLCKGSPLASTPLCGSQGEQPPGGGGGGGGGGGQPSAVPVEEGGGDGGGGDGGAMCKGTPLASTPLCAPQGEKPPEGGGGGGGGGAGGGSH